MDANSESDDARRGAVLTIAHQDLWYRFWKVVDERADISFEGMATAYARPSAPRFVPGQFARWRQGTMPRDFEQLIWLCSAWAFHPFHAGDSHIADEAAERLGAVFLTWLRPADEGPLRRIDTSDVLQALLACHVGHSMEASRDGLPAWAYRREGTQHVFPPPPLKERRPGIAHRAKVMTFAESAQWWFEEVDERISLLSLDPSDSRRPKVRSTAIALSAHLIEDMGMTRDAADRAVRSAGAGYDLVLRGLRLALLAFVGDTLWPQDIRQQEARAWLDGLEPVPANRPSQPGGGALESTDSADASTLDPPPNPPLTPLLPTDTAREARQTPAGGPRKSTRRRRRAPGTKASALRWPILLPAVIAAFALAVGGVRLVDGSGDPPDLGTSETSPLVTTDADGAAPSEPALVVSSQCNLAVPNGAVDIQPSALDVIDGDATLEDPRSASGGEQCTPSELPAAPAPSPFDEALDLVDRALVEDPTIAVELVENLEPSNVAEEEAVVIRTALAIAAEDPEAAYEEMMDAISRGLDSPEMWARAAMFQFRYEPARAGLKIRELANEYPDVPFVQLALTYQLFNAMQWERAVEASQHTETLYGTPTTILGERNLSSAIRYGAGALLQLHRHVEAVDAFERAASVQPLSTAATLDYVAALRGVGTDDATDLALELLTDLTLIPDQAVVALRLSADIHVARGNAPEALSAIGSAIRIARETGSPQAANHTSRAYALRLDGAELEEVIAELHVASGLDPEWPQPLADEAYVLYVSDPDRLPESITLIREAVASESAGSGILRFQCYLERMDGNLVAARRACDAAIGIDPFDPDSLNERARTALAEDDVSTAADYYERSNAVDANTDAQIGLCWVAAWFEFDGRPDPVTACEAAAESSGTSDSMTDYGHVLVLAGRFGAAERVLRDATATGPPNSRPWFELAKLYEILPQVLPSEVMSVWQRAHDVNEVPDQATLENFAEYAASIDHSAAVGLYDELIDLYADPDDVNPYWLVGRARALQSESVPQAATEFQRVISSDPLIAWQEGARIGIRRPLLVQALEAARDELDPYLWNQEYWRLTVAVNRCRQDRAIEMVDEFISSDPANRREYLSYLAWCYYSNGDLEAIADLAEAELPSDPALGLYLRGYWYYDSLGEHQVAESDGEVFESAIADLYASIDADPGFWRPYGALHFIFSQREPVASPEALRALWNEVHDQFGESGGWRLSEAAALFDLAPNDESILELLREAVTADPGDTVAHGLLGRYLAANGGNPEETESALRRAVAGGTDDSMVYRELIRFAEDVSEARILIEAAIALDYGRESPDFRAEVAFLWFSSAHTFLNPDVTPQAWAEAESAYLGLRSARGSDFATINLVRIYIDAFEWTRQHEAVPLLQELAENGSTIVDREDLRYWMMRILDVANPAAPELVAEIAELTPLLLDGLDIETRRDLADIAETLMSRWPTADGYRAARRILDLL